MRHSRTWLGTVPGVALAVLTLSMGCRDFVGHGSAARISHDLTTDAERYLAVAGTDVQGRSTYSVRVIATYTNPHVTPVILQTCAPGSLQYQVYVAGTNAPIGQMAGVFTLVYSVGMGSDPSDPRNTDTVVSNPFTITLPAST